MNKIVGTLNVIFDCTPFVKNKGNQLLPVPINKLLAPFNWNVGPLFICKLLQFSYIRRVLSSNSNFKTSPQVFNGIQFQTILEPSKCFFFHPILGALEVCLGSLSLSCWKTHDLGCKPSFLTLGSKSPGNLHTQSRHPVSNAPKQPQNIIEPLPYFTLGTVFFSLLDSFCF